MHPPMADDVRPRAARARIIKALIAGYHYSLERRSTGTDYTYALRRHLRILPHFAAALGPLVAGPSSSAPTRTGAWKRIAATWFGLHREDCSTGRTSNTMDPGTTAPNCAVFFFKLKHTGQTLHLMVNLASAHSSASSYPPSCGQPAAAENHQLRRTLGRRGRRRLLGAYPSA